MNQKIEISEVLCMGVAIFGEKELILEYAKKRKVIPYADIKEVGKEMVLTK